ncbi:MAG: hypothetical protein H7Z43_08280 [Clostridia bacterium]|nr:hypothetical protein [Deltaproteobacteria bacterium]
MLYVATILLMVAAACTRGEVTPPAATPERWVLHDVLAIGFAVPDTWIDKRATTGLVVSGPESETSYYTTISLQVVQPGVDATFDTILAAAYDDPVLETVAFGPSQALTVGESLARWYRIDFVVFDEPRRRVGVLVDDPPYVIDLSYAAPEAFFSDEVGVFERALATFYCEPHSR